MTEAITPRQFDRLVPQPRRPRVIWTLGAIAAQIGASPDFVADTLAKLPGTPVRKMGARWYALEDELMAFMREGPV